MVEAVPSASDRAFAISIEIRLSVVGSSVMLAGNIEYLPLRACKDLVHRVEFAWFG